MALPNRRTFMKSAGVAAGAAAFAAPAIARSNQSANDRFRVAVVGLGGRGRHSHCGALREMVKENVEIAALCDCDENRMNATAAEQEKFSGKKPALFKDYKKLLEDKSIDGVALATPNHWHALQTIWACQAGKDVYCEKPGSWCIAEGRKMVEAARKYQRMVQHGTQCRNSPKIREGIAKLQEGVIGRVYGARGIAFKYRAGGKRVEEPVPATVDWDAWVGPAKYEPYTKLAVHRWRFLRNFGNGEIGDQGVHQLDIIRWGLGLKTHPVKAMSLATCNFRPTSDEDTGGQQIFACVYKGADEGRDLVVQFETRDGYTNPEAGMGTTYPFVDHRNCCGVIFLGTEGYMIIPDYSSYYVFLGRKHEPGPNASVAGAPMMDLDQFQNWYKAVRSRDYNDLTPTLPKGIFRRRCRIWPTSPRSLDARSTSTRPRKLSPRRRGQQVADARIPRFLRGAGRGVSGFRVLTDVITIETGGMPTLVVGMLVFLNPGLPDRSLRTRGKRSGAKSLVHFTPHQICRQLAARYKNGSRWIGGPSTVRRPETHRHRAAHLSAFLPPHFIPFGGILMSYQTSRRRFLQTTAVASVGYWVAGGAKAQESTSPNEKVNMASIGIGGKGRATQETLATSAKWSLFATSIADVSRAPANALQMPRPLSISGRCSTRWATRSTPSRSARLTHMHAPAALAAMRLGKHCFCQKPLTHSVYESRVMAQVAREKGVKTQMGNQGTASNGIRETASLVKSGFLGTPKEVHVWTNRPIWPQGGPRPEPKDPPETLAWDLWLGVAKKRPYGNGYHPFAWRGWWDFGTGALGDMGCHTINTPYMALDLKDPIAIQATTSGHNGDSFPKWSIITYEFAATNTRPALKMIWYDGGKRPDKDLLDGDSPEACGSLIVGEKGKISSNGNGSGYKIYGGLKKPETIDFVKSPGHFAEWVEAIRGGGEAVSNFPDYAGGLNELVLLGNLAVWEAPEADKTGKKVAWDAKAMKVTNIDGLEPILKPTYPEGYQLDG